MDYEKLPTMRQINKSKIKLLREVKKEGFNSIEHFRDFYSQACNFADVDVPLTQCFELALSGIQDEDERNDKASRLSDIVINYYWHF